MDPFGTIVSVSTLGGEYVVVIAAVIVFFLARRGPRRSAAADVARPIFARTIVVTIGVLGFAANLLFLLPLTPLPTDLPPGVPSFRGPLEVLPAWTEYAIVPTVGAIAQLVFIVMAARWVKSSRGTARGLDPRARGWLSFLPRRILTISVTLVGLIVVTTIVTGLAATQDSLGRSVLLQINTPDGYGQTPFPGWYYTVPALIATLALVALAGVALTFIARPPSLRGSDDSARRRAATQIGGAALGFLAVTLGRLWIFAALGGSMTAQVTGDQGSAWIVTSFQAVTPLLALAGAVLVGAGLATFALLILPLRTRVKTPVEPGVA